MYPGAPTPRQASADPTPPQETLTASLDQSLVGTLLLLLDPGVHKVLSVPSRSLSLCFPSPVEALQSNPTGLQSLTPWGSPAPLPAPLLAATGALWGSASHPSSLVQRSASTPQAGASSQPLPVPPGPHSQQKIEHSLIHPPWFPHDHRTIKASLHGGSEAGQRVVKQ